jgi:NAD(P)-dependent dehydrogenase (short-subunit alcohol dehydrogenase family)
VPALSGQVVIVTGASSGIGEAIARRLARAGAKVVITARRPERLNALARELDPDGARVMPIAGDVTNDADRRALVAGSLKKFGRIDALVNNAGFGTRGPLELVPVEAIRRNFETNVFSLIALTQLVIPAMRERGSGCVVNIGSVAGRIARPLSSVYDSTKHALEALTDGLRGEMKPFGVRVTLVRPGFIATEFISAADKASGDFTGTVGPYEPFWAATRAGVQKLRKVAGVPDDIARLVEKVLASDNPAPRYSAPFHAKIFLCAKWLIPDRLIEYVLRMKKSG